ncbi:MAG: cysteine desulfurase NifS, partial [Elusimicrobiota bacterium]
MKRIYLDHNATTPVHPDVVKAMLPYFTKIYGNESSVHFFGQQAHSALEYARERVAKFLGAEQPDEIVFTAGGTESDNHAIFGTSGAAKIYGNHIITSKIEHHAVLNPCKQLEKQGFKVTYLGVDRQGRINVEEVKKSIKNETVLVTIMYANNETGTIEPIEEIARVISEVNSVRASQERQPIYFHTDAVQCAGKIKLDVKKLGVDLLSISAHKFYGPKGVGALYIKKGTRIQPFIYGGHHEKSRRAGTVNVPGIAGLTKACEIAELKHKKESARLAGLKERLWKGIRENIKNVHLNGDPLNCIPNTLNVSFEFVEAESLLLNLDLKGIAVSSGSACTSGSVEPSHVLTAMGIDPVIAQGSIRFSLGRDNTEEDIDYVVKVLPQIV